MTKNLLQQVMLKESEHRDVMAKQNEIFNAEENVFAPAIVWAKFVTKPVLPEPAIGILNVCVDPVELILKLLPDEPVAKYWIPAVSAFKVVKPVPLLVAVIGTQDITPATSDCKTEVPVAGLVDGKVYTVLPDAEDTNAV